MRIPKLRQAALALLAFVLLHSAALWAAEDVWTGVERIVAVGDVHGDYNQFVTVLRNAAVIDQKNKWMAGKTHLVQTGDVLDRGGGSRKVMDLLMELEKQARKAGGAVHALIGNHETMNIYGDLSYTTPEELASYGGADEHRLQFGPTGTYGAWIRSHNAIIQINDTLFLHGGISPKYAGYSVRRINEQIRSELADLSKLEGGMIVDPDGPLWYRGLAELSSAQLAPQVELVLKNYGVRRIVVGHTPTAGVIMPRLGGRVLLIDVGMTRVFGGPPACLVLEAGKSYAIHRGVKLEVPPDSGAARAKYLRAVAQLEPK